MTEGIWIARDRSGVLYAYHEKPRKIEPEGFYQSIGKVIAALPEKLFPEVTYETGAVNLTVGTKCCECCTNKVEETQKKVSVFVEIGIKKTLDLVLEGKTESLYFQSAINGNLIPYHDRIRLEDAKNLKWFYYSDGEVH